MAERIQGPVTDRGLQLDTRVGGLRTPEKVEKTNERDKRRWRPKIPTLEELQSIFIDGQILLPLRYFRGHYLDILV